MISGADWTGPINQLLYGLIYTQDITRAEVDSTADQAMNRTSLIEGPEIYYAAINEALTSGVSLEDAMVPQLDHATIAAFLRAVAVRLEVLRPWPERAFCRYDDADLESLAATSPIAELDSWTREIVSLLHMQFDHVEANTLALSIRPDTGEILTLIGTRQPADGIVLLTSQVNDATATIDHFLAATGFPRDRLRPLPPVQRP